MNKRLQLAILSITMSVCFEANAQTGFCEHYKNLLPAKYEAYKLANAVNRSTAKTTGTAERLIGRAKYKFEGGKYAIDDSVNFMWSGSLTSNYYGSGSTATVFTNSADLQHFWTPDGSGKGFNPLFKRVQKFNSNQELVESVGQNWDLATSKWENNDMLKYSYLAGKLQNVVSHNWVKATADWSDPTRITYTYSGAMLVEWLTEIWDKSSASWKKSEKSSCSYIGGNMVEKLDLYWNEASGKWINFSKESRTYIGVNMSDRNTYMWDEVSSKWINEYQSKVNYSGSDIVDYTNEIWDKTTNDWGWKSLTFHYYTSSKLDHIIEQFWDFSTGTAVNSYRFDYTYTGSEITNSEESNWNYTTKVWDKKRQYLYSFNANNSIIQSMENEMVSGSWIPALYNSKQNFYYETYTGINEDTPYVSSVNIYPNPATASNVYVDYFTQQSEQTDVVLSNILGQEILRKTEAAGIGDHSVMIPVSSLSSGMYVVSIYSNGQLQKTMKLVK